MRHRVKGRKLGRTKSHRLATLRALSTSLLKHKRIKTTVAKAKETRTFVEPLITKARENSVHARRIISAQINDREVVKELFDEVVTKIGDRKGGYTRVVRLGRRHGDAAELAILELVDYNDMVQKKPSKSKKKAEEVEEVKEKEAPKDKKDIEEAEVVEEKAEKPKAKKTTAKKTTKKETSEKPKAKKPAAKKEDKEEK
jgi:large subunit ribosomal protein L17